MVNLSDWKEFNDEKSHFSKIPIESFAAKGKWADQFIESRYKDLKINQLRNFFGELQLIQSDPTLFKPENKTMFGDKKAMLEMNLAYDFGRNVITKEFYDLITESLKKVQQEDDFDKFVVFIKSLIAYHKYYEKMNK